MMRWGLLVMAAVVSAGACGDDDGGGQLADAPPGAIDARPPAVDAAPDAGPLGVIVTVTLGGAPAAGQTVYFQSRDWATTETVLTGADGNATAIVEAGGYVTVVKPELELGDPTAIGPTAHLSTFAAVQPGDHLFVDVPFQRAEPTSVALTINVPNEEQGRDYDLHSTCGSAFLGTGNSPARSNRRTGRARKPAIAAVPVSNRIELTGCGDTADMLIISTDSEGGPRGWLYRAAVPVTPGGTVDFVGEYAPLQDQTFTYTVFPGTFEVDVARELRTARGVFYRVNGSVGFEGTTSSTTLAVPVPPGVLAVTTSSTRISEVFSEASVVDWGANTSYELDFAAVGLHAYGAEAGFEATPHAVTWTEALDGQTPQLTIASVRATRFEEEGSHRWTWDLVTPWTERTATYPVLPTTLFDFNMKSDDEPALLRLTTAQVPGGYNAARARVFAAELRGEVTGATGRMVFEDLANRGLTRKIPTSFRREGFTRPAR